MEKNGGLNYGYIDKAGQLVTKLEYGVGNANDFSEGLATIELWNGDIIFIDNTGKEVVRVKGDEIKSFSEGLVAIKRDGKWGYIDTKGNLVIECQFETALEFSEGLAAVKKDGKYGYIDTKGNLVIDYIFEYAYNFSEGRALVEKMKNGNFKRGYIDTKGNLVIDYQYDNDHYVKGAFSDGLALVTKDDKYAYINKDGEIVIGKLE